MDNKSVSAQKVLQDFYNQYPVIRYKRGEHITRPFYASNYIYHLHKGFIRQYSLSEDGQEFTISIHSPRRQYIASEISLGERAPNHYFEAMSEALMHRVPRKDIYSLYAKNPDLWLDAYRRLMAGLDHLQVRMESITFGNARNKVASVLLVTAKNHGSYKDNVLKLLVPLRHRDLAALTGLSRETVSIEMSKFKKEGLISADKAATILDVEKFAQASGVVGLLERLRFKA